MKYFKRYRTTGEPFYVNESGDQVSEQVARTNLVESSRRATSVAEFCEQTMFGESAADRRRRSSTAADRGDRSAARNKMEEAFHRLAAIATGQREVAETSRNGKGRISVSVSRQQATSAMEEALARFVPHTARA